MRLSSFLRIAVLLTLFLGQPSQAWALAGDWQGDADTRARLISATDAVGQDKTLSLGLEVEMAEDWHTYWRSPGMAGLPPQFDWKESLTESGNLSKIDLLYPAPQRHFAFGLETIGYKGHVVFPLTATLREAGKPIKIDTDLNLLVCKDLCVPKNLTLTLALPAGEAKASAEAPLIQSFRERMAGDSTASGILIRSIHLSGNEISVEIESREKITDPDLFVENDKGFQFIKPVTAIKDGGMGATLTIKPDAALTPQQTLAGTPMTLTITNGPQALEQKIEVPAPTTAAPQDTPTKPNIGLLWAVLLALLGGLILNLMPCVLPVLSLKVLSVIGHGGGESKAVRKSFLLSASGIIVSFLALSGITIALKLAGHSLGWGVQFQQPYFLLFLTIIVTFFAASLWDLFEINLPSFLSDGLSKAIFHPKLAGDFATGAFATLLATPCTAPFLGTAVSFALTSPPAIILTIFFSMGVGMALPYLLIASLPQLATSLPKPGAWMVWLRRVLGLALFLTAIWLVWIMAAQITAKMAASLGLALTALVIFLSLRKHQSRLTMIAGILIFIGYAVTLTHAGMQTTKPITEVDTHWTRFSPNALAANLAEGKTVFLDITADWCLTCKANKKFILEQSDIYTRLFDDGVVAMQADWTNPDPEITAFLQKHGRYGIPFNAVYGKNAPEGIVLPELLTRDAVYDALEKASGEKMR